ncbi:MAG TPA: PE-PPE domain-containing protein, partial [Mycobacterium sp.]|nr:PE-PPE domain-containing protein [Mycobacterium sp.]
MRKSAKAVILVIVSIVGSIALGLASAFSAALAFGAVALIVPGTGTPNANIVTNYMEQARDRFLGGTACGPTGAGCPDANLHGIDYPASFWPLAIFPSWCRSGPDGCDKWDESVGKGTTALQNQLDFYLNTTSEKIVIFGYSQGGAVVSNVVANFGDLTPEERARIQVVTIGGIQNPDGGLWPRLGFLGYIPILQVTLTPPMTPNTGVNYTSFGFQYDPVVNAPRYWGNAFAMLNAIAAFDNVHGYYLAPNGNNPSATLPYGYTDATLAEQLDCSANPGNCRKDQYGNTYVTIPATSLPIMNLILSSTPSALTPLVKPLVDLFSPVYRVLADLGYDYSGNPSVPTPLSILPFNPFQNWVGVGFNLLAATGQGIQAFLNDLGVGAAIAPVAPPPMTTSTLAARTIAPQAVDPQADASDALASVTALSSAKKSTPVATETDAVGVADVTEPATDAAPAKSDANTTSITTEPATTEPAKTEPAKTEPTKAEPTKTEPVKTEP